MSKYRDRKFFAGAFSLIELQVTLIILATAVWGFAALFRVYSLQTEFIEQETLPVSTYYVVSQTSRWMRQLGVPADMAQEAGQTAWEPPVEVSQGGSSIPTTVEVLGSWLVGTTHLKEAGTGRALILITHAEHNRGTSLDIVTYGGQPMTKIIDRVGTNGTTRTYVAAFILDEAGITSSEVSGTFNFSWSRTPDSVIYSSVFLGNVDQTTLVGDTASSRTSSGDAITTSALTTSSGDMVIDAAVCSNTGSYTVNNVFDEVMEPSITDATAVIGSKVTTGIDETPSVTHSTIDGRQSLIGLVIRIDPALAGSGGTGGTSDPISIAGTWTAGTAHTAESGTNRALLFIAHAEENGSTQLASVTYGGRAMTRIVSESIGFTYQAYVVAFVLDEAGISSATDDTFVPIWTSTPDNVSYNSVFLVNVDQIDLIGETAVSSIEGSNILATGALATNDRDMVIAAATCGNIGDYTLLNSFNEALEQDMVSSTGAVGYKAATGADETPSVQHTNANRQVLIGFVMQAVDAAPPLAEYQVQLNSLTKDFDTEQAVATVRLFEN
ncbi:MAG: hypothetical protein JW806_02400 [Sedimentisphaerales bacterium]|nr:hypothetical protein [Sedimentisphaerales bacterium]